MNKVTPLALAAALAFIPAAVQAQGVSVDAGAAVSGALDTSASNGDTSASANAGASVDAGASITFDDLLSDVGTTDISGSVSAATSATADSTINIVEVSSLEGSADVSATALADATTANSANLDQLHTAVAANAAIQAKLTASGHDTDDVVALKTDAQGALWVYVDAAE
jgi:hypothetical protein